MNIQSPPLLYWLSALLLTGCSTSSRYQIDEDVAPKQPISVEHIEDAHPQYEPYSLGGNKNYTINGKKYTIIKDPNGYKAHGLASWYGKKFHGHRTSNGEIYDMYSMSAAHKTLPIPCYVKVTNTKNGKTVIVRVNDRGPFHPHRIIDLSYAAAYKLGMLHAGTAPVIIEFIPNSRHNNTQNTAKTTQNDYVIQVSSSKHLQITRTLSANLSQKLSVVSFIDSSNGSHRVFLGPFNDFLQTQQTLEKVKMLGYDTAFIRNPPVVQKKSNLAGSH